MSTYLVSAGHGKPADPEILIVMDRGYDVAYLCPRPDRWRR